MKSLRTREGFATAMSDLKGDRGLVRTKNPPHPRSIPPQRPILDTHCQFGTRGASEVTSLRVTLQRSGFLGLIFSAPFFRLA